MPIDLTPADLARLWELERAATPGPWEDGILENATRSAFGVLADAKAPNPIEVCVTPDLHAYRKRDAALIAAARNALPGLLDAAEERDRLRGDVERLNILVRSRSVERDGLTYQRATSEQQRDRALAALRGCVDALRAGTVAPSRVAICACSTQQRAQMPVARPCWYCEARAALAAADAALADAAPTTCARCSGRGWVYGYNEGVPCSQDPCPVCDAAPTTAGEGE